MADNRYRTFKYGTSHKYGVSSNVGQEGILAWGVDIDWDGDGYFDGVNDAFWMLKAPSIQRGRRTMLRPAGQGFESVMTGQAIITLSNHDGRYDAWNTSSPLYPNVESGKDVRIRVRDLGTGQLYDRFYGVITNIDPVGYDTEAAVIITVEDGLRYLHDVYPTVNRPYFAGSSPAAPDDIAAVILSAAQWPARWGRNLTGREYGIRYWYADGSRSAAAELEDLAGSFLGYMYVDRTGAIVLKDRFSDQFSTQTILQPSILKDIGNPQPWNIHRDVVKIIFHVRDRADDVVVWQPSATEPPIDPGESREYIVDFSYNGNQAHLENLESLVHFSLSPNIPSPGAQPNGSMTVVLYGTKAFLSFTNNDSVPIYLFPGDLEANPLTGDATYVRGDVTWTERTETVSSPRNPTGGQRALVLDSLWFQDKSRAYEFADRLQEFLTIRHKTPIIQIEKRHEEQFDPDLFDVVTVDLPKLGISSKLFRIGGIVEEAVRDSTQAVRTTFYLEPFLEQTSGAAVWGTSLWGTGKWSW